MENCKNCFSPIDDMRKETRCSVCSSPLHKGCAINDGGAFCDVCYTVKSEDKPTVEFEIPEVIRRSYIEVYRACPFQFYNQVIKGFEQPANIYSQLGIDMHTLFDRACQNKDYLKEKMLADFGILIDGYDDKLYDVPWEVGQEKMQKKGMDCIETFYSVLANLPEVPYATEETIQFSVGEGLPLVQTTSDRIDMVNGELEMIDWKTGKVMVGQKISHDLQAPLYIYGVRQKYQLPVQKFTFYYLEENKIRVFERINNEEYVCKVNNREYFINIMDGVREVQSMFAQIKKGNFNIPRNIKGMYYTCKMCHFQKQEICKGADVESWRQYNMYA